VVDITAKINELGNEYTQRKAVSTELRIAIAKALYPDPPCADADAWKERIPHATWAKALSQSKFVSMERADTDRHLPRFAIVPRQDVDFHGACGLQALSTTATEA
jgi:hypothetical protein